MNVSMLIVGVLFWLQIIASPPLRVRILVGSPKRARRSALVATNVVMFINGDVDEPVLRSHVVLRLQRTSRVSECRRSADQLLGAGMLWVCGDFWAVPALIVVVRRLIAREDSDVDSAIEHLLGQGSDGRLKSRASGWT
jgi:hypothetical protein